MTVKGKPYLDNLDNLDNEVFEGLWSPCEPCNRKLWLFAFNQPNACTAVNKQDGEYFFLLTSLFVTFLDHCMN